MMRIRFFIYLLFGIMWRGLVPAFAQQSNVGMEKMFFYHHDHLGNTVCVTDEAGEVVQHVEYLPTGEVFIEEKNPASTYATSYKFNGKELDEETGLYYYGVRYYNPRFVSWISTDPLELKYPNVSSYCYVMQNPTNNIDLKGDSTILYATRLPGGPSILAFATHTFVAIERDDMAPVIYSFGSEKNGLSGSVGGKLGLRHYTQDTEVVNGKNAMLKIRIPIVPPEGMTVDEFDKSVINAANNFGNVNGIDYFIYPLNPTKGNCNTSTTTLLYKAGISIQKLDEIESVIPGIKWGFGIIKPWTEKEQRNAIKKEIIRREKMINDRSIPHLRR